MIEAKKAILTHSKRVLLYLLAGFMLVLWSLVAVPAYAQQKTGNQVNNGLIVVRDAGGVHTLPYYQEYGLTNEPELDKANALSFAEHKNSVQAQRVTDAAMLPVRSKRMNPGLVTHRTIHAPGLRAVFLMGDDDLSKRWLVERLSELKELDAVGLVVNVENIQALEELRRLAPGLMLSPVSGDDISIRLDLLYYPALITVDSISQ